MMRTALSLITLLITLTTTYSQSLSYEGALAKCDSIRQELSQHPELTGWDAMVHADCLTGAMLPDFKATTMDGKIIDRNYFLGKVTIVNFWMKTCKPCIWEIPGLDKIKERFGTEQVNFLAIGRTDVEETEVFLKAHPWTYDQIKNGKPLIEDVFKFMWGYPVTFIVNQQGQIVLSFNGGASGEGASQIIYNRLVPVIEDLLN